MIPGEWDIRQSTTHVDYHVYDARLENNDDYPGFDGFLFGCHVKVRDVLGGGVKTKVSFYNHKSGKNSNT